MENGFVETPPHNKTDRFLVVERHLRGNDLTMTRTVTTEEYESIFPKGVNGRSFQVWNLASFRGFEGSFA